MSGYQKEKRIILDYYQALDSANDTRITEVLDTFTSKNYLWRAFHPFGLQTDVNEIAELFWKPPESRTPATPEGLPPTAGKGPIV